MEKIREVTNEPELSAIYERARPLNSCSYYGLTPGEDLRITTGLKPYFQESMPRRIEFLEEYRCFLLCRAHYGEESEGRIFRFCINKASLICGETKVKRVSTGEMLR